MRNQSLKWVPRDLDGTIGVPEKGYIKCSDFSQEDLDNLIARAKNRKQDVNVFLHNAGLKKVNPQAELDLSDPREFEKEEQLTELELNPHAEPRTKAPKKEKAKKPE